MQAGSFAAALETEVIQVIINYRGRERQFHFHIHTALITADKFSHGGNTNFCLIRKCRLYIR